MLYVNDDGHTGVEHVTSNCQFVRPLPLSRHAMVLSGPLACKRSMNKISNTSTSNSHHKAPGPVVKRTIDTLPILPCLRMKWIGFPEPPGRTARNGAGRRLMVGRIG